MVGRSLLGALFLSEPEGSDSLCLCEVGGGGRRGTWDAGLDSSRVGCVSWHVLMGEVTFDWSSRSRESSCTTTSTTSAPVVFSGTDGASSQTDPVPERSGDGGTEESFPSFFSSLSLFSSAFFSTTADPSSSSPSLSSEFPKPSCVRAWAMFLR